jgi:hypothetical protein
VTQDRFVDEVVGLRGLLGDGVDGVLVDLALLPGHARMLVIGADVGHLLEASSR